MAFLRKAITPEEVKRTPIAELRTYCNKIFEKYNKMLDGDIVFCPYCGMPKAKPTAFYSDKRFKFGVFPQCKDCVRLEVEQRTDTRQEPNETEESVQKMLKKMDLPYIDALYKKCVKNVADDVGEHSKSSPFLSYLTQVKSLPQYSGYNWMNSDFGLDGGEDITIKDTRKNQKIIRDGKKRFGLNYTNEDVYWLENEYQDWIARYPCESKAQEMLFKTLTCQEYEREQLRIKGKNTKDVDTAIQNTMAALNIKPSQSKTDALVDSLSMGQLIEKWELEKPIPEPEDEFKDPDKIGLYIDVFFKGHLAKMMGLKNAFSTLYEKVMDKYRVKKPELNEEEDEALFNQIFGNEMNAEGI